jgi:hypothetical protein
MNPIAVSERTENRAGETVGYRVEISGWDAEERFFVEKYFFERFASSEMPRHGILPRRNFSRTTRGLTVCSKSKIRCSDNAAPPSGRRIFINHRLLPKTAAPNPAGLFSADCRTC